MLLKTQIVLDSEQSRAGIYWFYDDVCYLDSELNEEIVGVFLNVYTTLTKRIIDDFW